MQLILCEKGISLMGQLIDYQKVMEMELLLKC